MCLKYPEVRGFLGRNSLEDFKKSTMLTLYDVFKMFGLKADIHFTHNQQEKYFEFFQTGSRIYYNELGYYPSDPDYNYLGGTEYTFAGIDEAQQVQKKAKNVLRSRIRYKVSFYKLIPKLGMTCNPDKGFLYTDFYNPTKSGTLPIEKKFVKSLANENNFIDATYIKNLEGIDDVATKERLLFGNWEYDADPSKLMEYDALMDLFTNIVPHGTEKYITADVARQGQDKTVLYYWEGFACKRVEFYEKLPLLTPADRPDVFSTEKAITNMREKYAVPLSRVIVDEDGMGGGLKDRLGCQGFLNGSKPLQGQNYANLKTQCYYKLARRVNQRGISVLIEDSRIRDWLVQELEQVRSKNADRDGKLMILGKDEVKLRIGRSPDFSDALAMREWFELFPRPDVVWIDL